MSQPQDKNNKYYLPHFSKLLLSVVGLLFLLGTLIPEGSDFKGINLLADIQAEKEELMADKVDSQVEEAPQPQVITKPTLEEKKPIETAKEEKLKEFLETVGLDREHFLAIEDYSHKGSASWRNFLLRLAASERGDRPLRIAMLGDSFIEGDIFSGSLRQRLQADFGGLGVGFMGMYSETSGFRKTIKHFAKGWQEQSVLNSPKTPQMLTGRRFLPQQGAWTQFRMPEGQACYELATIYYSSMGTAELNLKNDEGTKTLSLPNTYGELSSFTLYSGQEQKDLKLNFTALPKGFVAYGVALDAQRGIALDNYSLRGASGYQLASLDRELTRAFAEARPYDLIIIEYGLNASSVKQKRYDSYRKSMTKAIKNLQSYYPNTAILLLGISDRDQKNSKQLHQNVLELTQQQRRLAEECGLAFWSILEAIVQEGGIKKLTEKGLAAKDFTHLSHKGGSVISDKLYYALKGALYNEAKNQ